MHRTSCSIAVALLLLAGASSAQVRDPLPNVEKKGIAVEVRNVVRLPDTRGLRPISEDVNPSGWARVSFVIDAPDGRRFANDSRGQLYIVSGDKTSLYADVAAAFPYAFYGRLESGFIGFAFHPEFAKNGLFYTVHLERVAGNPGKLNFIPPGFAPKDVTFHNVITEWHATDPKANTFAGTRRELLRTAHVVTNSSHPLGFVGFNPTAKPGSPDYGLLYTSGSDFGFSNGGGPNSSNAFATQRLDSIVTAILRIDPRSPSESHGTKGLGDYTVPAVNKFAADNDPNTLGEIYAYGLRNTHRISWDTDGTMFGSDIGMSNIEEINILHEGANYGWMAREGTFENGRWRGGDLDQVFALPEDVRNGKNKDAYTYPVAMFDHGDGVAVSAGFAYHGKIEQLQGKFVFGDVNRGRIFVADVAAMKAADDGIPATVAPVEEVQLYVTDGSGRRVYTSFRELVEGTMGKSLSRTDLHISQSKDGELFLTSRQDGMIRMLVPDSGGGRKR
jgi:hypothetical protein